MSRHAASGRLRVLATRLRQPGMGRLMVQTAGFNVGANLAAAVGGVIFARAVGPAVRGEYAAVTSWFGVAFTLGEMGQPGALCYYVAQDPRQARGYVATSRTMMLATGVLTLAVGLVLAPVLAHGNPGLTIAYRFAFAGLIVALVGDSYTSALQARNLDRWNVVRLSQPALALVAMGGLYLLRALTIYTALGVVTGTLTIKLGWAYLDCLAQQARAWTHPQGADQAARQLRDSPDRLSGAGHDQRLP